MSVNLRNSAVAMVEKVKGDSETLVTAFRAGGVAGVATAVAMTPTMTSFAAEGGTNLLSGEVLASLTNAFASIVITGTAVIVMGITAGVSMIGLSAAAKYSLKKLKGVLSSAA